MASLALLQAVVTTFELDRERRNPRRYRASDGISMMIGPATGMLMIRTRRYNLSIGDRPGSTDYLYVNMGGHPSREDYLQLAKLDGRLDSRLSEWLGKHDYTEYAEQVKNHGLALQAGREAIPSA